MGAQIPEVAAGMPAGLGPGSRVAGYVLEERIGAGGMAVVFRAVDEGLGRRVAVKVLAPGLAADTAFRRRFIRESRAAAAVDDPHIIPVHEAGESGGVLFIAMRYVPGPDVRALIAEQGPLPPARVAAIISPVASALDAAHAAGLVHRDVKPANMLLDVRPGRPDHVYLSDFGLAKAALASVALTASGQFLGTPAYVAPEQILGQAADGRTDQYALACAAFEMLTAHAPFERDQGMAVIWAHLHAEPPPLASVRFGLPPAADPVLARALAKEPDNRYPTCTGFADSLRAALGQAAYHSAPDHDLPAGHAATQIAGPAADEDRLRRPAAATTAEASESGTSSEPQAGAGGSEPLHTAPAPLEAAALVPGQDRQLAAASQAGPATAQPGLTESAPIPQAASSPTVTAAALPHAMETADKAPDLTWRGESSQPPRRGRRARRVAGPARHQAKPDAAAAKLHVLRSAAILAGLTARNLREMLQLLLNGPAGLVGLAIIVLTLSLGGRTVARAERLRAAALLRERIGAPPPRPPAHGLSGLVGRRLADPVTWRAVAYLLLLVVLGIPGFITALIWAIGFPTMLQPVWVLFGTSAVQINGQPVQSIPADTVLVLAGLLAVILMPRAARGIASLNRAWARRLLAPHESPELASSNANPALHAD